MKYSTKTLDIEAIGITIASGKEIRSWAERKLPNGKIVGEVSSADTVRLKNLKPIKDGLFCERIFGPVKDFVCSCGKYHKIKREKRKQELSYSYYCRQCEVAITISKERRYRLGYIRLHSLVTHVWFFKDRSANPLPEWVEIDKKLLELISYCAVEFLQYNYPHTTFSQKLCSNPDTRNHNIGRHHINFSNYFFIQSCWLNLFEIKSDFSWFAKLYAQNKKNLLNTIKLKKRGVKKNTFLKIEKKSIFSDKCTFLKYSRSNIFLLTPEIQTIYLSTKNKKILFKNNSKLTKQKTFLLKIKKISLVPSLFPFEKTLLFVFLFHFLKNFFFFNEKTLATCVNKKKNYVFTQFKKFIIFFTHFEENKRSQYFAKNGFLSTYFSKKIIIGNCFKKKEFQEKTKFSDSKLDQYPFHKYTNSIIYNTANTSTSLTYLWKKFCIFLVLGERRACWVLKTKKKIFVYKFFIPQITLGKKKNFLFDQKKPFLKKRNFNHQTPKIEARFVFSSKIKNNILQKQKSKCFKQNHTLVETTKVKTTFYNTSQNKSLVSRFVKSLQQSKIFFSTRKQTFDFKNSIHFHFFQSLVKSKLFFHFIIFQKINIHNFKKVEKKLWWWFFLKRKKKNSFQHQHWKNSLLKLYLYNEITFFSQNIFFEKKKFLSLMPNLFSSYSVATIARLVLNSTKTNYNQRNGKKTKITFKKKTQTKVFNNQEERSKKRLHDRRFHKKKNFLFWNFIIKTKKSKIDNEKIKTKSPLFLLSNFLYHRGDGSSFQLKEKVQNQLTYESCRNLEKKKQLLKKVKKNKNLRIQSIFYYENIVKKQVFQLALSLFSNFSILYSFYDRDIDKIFFSPPIQTQLILNSSSFFFKKKYGKLPISIKKTKLHKEFLQSKLYLQTKLQDRKKNVRKRIFSNLVKSIFEGINTKFMHSKQLTQPLLQKKKIQICRSDFKTHWIFNKTKVFSLQCLSFSSELFLKLWNKKKFFFDFIPPRYNFSLATNFSNKKNFHTIPTNQFHKKNKSFLIFLFLKKKIFLKTFLNLNLLLVLKNSFNLENLLKTLPQIYKSISPQQHFLNQNLKIENVVLPSRSTVKLMKNVSPFTNLQIFDGGLTKSIKNYKLAFLHTNLILTSKTSSYCLSTLKPKPYTIETNTSTFSSYLFFFYFNVLLILFKSGVFENILPLSDAFIYPAFQLTKKNLFVGFFWMKLLQKKKKKLQTKNKKNTNLRIRHKFFYFSGRTRPIIFWFFETIKSSLFLLFFIESFITAPQSRFLIPTNFGLTKTGPQAIFHLLNRYAPFKGHVSSSTIIDLNNCRKKIVPLPYLLQKAPFLFRKFRLKSKRILSKYRQANRMLKILEEYPNVGEKKRGSHILSQMFLSVIPVLPPTLRPILPLPGNVTAISDLNRLYQRILYRNTRFLKTPEPYYAHRILQEAVDALIENGKGGSKPVSDQKNRPYKSLSDILKGKQGRFRQNLLGKRVDYSGRSVIVVGPQLHIHECGLPKQMAIELFQPFLLRALKNFRVVNNIFEAKKIIEKEDPIVWKVLHQILPSYPILLNRAPTLHRLGIQAFQPKLVSGQAILLHPLVCTAFNADFDGDQMAVHIPLSMEARSEAWNLMWARHHLFSAATGQPIIVPSQDMVLGVYFLTTNPFQYFSGSGFLFNTFDEVIQAYENHQVHLQTSVWVKTNIVIETGFDVEQPLEIRLTFLGNCIYRFVNVQSHYNEKGSLFKKYICTTPGRILMNQLIALN